VLQRFAEDCALVKALPTRARSHVLHDLDAGAGMREPDGEPLHRAPERHLVLGLNEHVKMIALDRDLHHADLEPVGPLGQRGADDLEAALLRLRRRSRPHRVWPV
jgi:hypothetical protein